MLSLTFVNLNCSHSQHTVPDNRLDYKTNRLVVKYETARNDANNLRVTKFQHRHEGKIT